MLLLMFACSGGGSTAGTSPPSATAPAPTVPAPTVPVPAPTTPVYDPASGFERTADGAVNRVADVPSSPEDYAYGTDDCYGSQSGTEPECVPSDCTEAPNGRCASESCLTSWCLCVYACTSDADCAATEACLRPEHGLDAGIPLPHCVPAECRTGADCASGECGVAAFPSSPTGQLHLGCRTPADACRTDADCEALDDGDQCTTFGSSWECACSHCWCD